MNLNISKKWLVILLLPILYVGYRVYTRPIPCATPISYKIGTIVSGFGVSQAQFQKDITQAAAIWSNAIGKPLFVYDPKGSLTVNLIYDDRQQKTQEEQKLNGNIDATSEVASSVKAQYATLQSNYLATKSSYESALTVFNAAQTAYNSTVQYWNSRGGAPQAEYNSLQTQKSALAVQQSALEQKRQAVNDLADTINALIDKYNLLVSHINANVDAINNDGLSGTQFEEGVYISDNAGTRINIYQFDNQTYFIRVLAHELGHALQLDHNSDPLSIMNPVNDSTNLTLSKEDLQELKTECRL